jgi:glycosyltransferase involved in cell wall biosynthesis
MIIGVDASCWANKRGYGRYTRELLRALLALDQQNQYRFFLDAATASQSDDLPEQAQQVVIKTSQAAAEAASASGHRSLRDLWAMRQGVHQSGQDLDLFYFPSVYTYFPFKGSARVVVTIHDTTAERYPRLIFPNWRSRLLWKLKVRWAVRQASLITTVSEASRRHIMEEFGVREGEVRVVPDAVNTQFHPLEDRSHTPSALAQCGIGAQDAFILYVGGISPHKNLATLVEAYASLVRRKAGHEVKLVLVGDFQRDVFYSSYTELKRKVEALGVSEKVIFTGFVSDPQLLHFYNAATLLVLPSFDEGFGLPVLEAMACGTPVVASRAGALPEVVGEAGLLFDPYAPEELRDRLERMLEDASLRQEMGRKGLARAKEFSWENSARAALAAFQELEAGP